MVLYYVLAVYIWRYKSTLDVISFPECGLEITNIENLSFRIRHTLVQLNYMGKRVTIDLSKKESKDQELIQSSTTPGPGYQWESDNFTIRHHKREPRGQPFPSK